MFTRYCPICNKLINHKNKRTCDKSERDKKLCGHCAALKREANLTELQQTIKNKKISEKNSNKILSLEHKQLLSEANSGNKNPMFGKSIYSVWLEKYGKEVADQRYDKYCNNCKGKTYSDEINKTKGRGGPQNAMAGRSVYDVWLEKYGKEIADKKLAAFKKKQSINSGGTNNPMYGKPSPQGSGNGWSGWYKSYFFRSLLELSYLKYLIDNGVKFETGEQFKHQIKYYDSHKNFERNYYPDFYLIETQEFIEVKPKKLINTRNNQDKFKKAKGLYGDKFKIMTEDNITKLDIEVIIELYDKHEIKFMQRYEEKFIKAIYKNQ